MSVSSSRKSESRPVEAAVKRSIDVEQVVAFQDPYHYEFTEAAFMLAFWSILVMTEGVVRFVEHGKPAALYLFRVTDTEPSRFWGALLGATFELLSSIMSLFVGLSGSLLDWYSHSFTCCLMLLQFFLGLYTFIAYVIVLPVFKLIHESPQLGLDPSASRFVGVLGILASTSFSFALQGGQFIWLSRMIAFSGPDDFLFHRQGSGLRAVCWNINYALAGVWTAAAGVIIVHSKGPSLTPTPIFAPPIIGSSAVLLLLTGLVMAIWGIIGVILSARNSTAFIREYIVISFFLFLVVWGIFTVGSLGFISDNPTPSSKAASEAALQNHLVFMLSFLGPYFMYKEIKAKKLEM